MEIYAIKSHKKFFFSPSRYNGNKRSIHKHQNELDPFAQTFRSFVRSPNIHQPWNITVKEENGKPFNLESKITKSDVRI